MGGANGFPAVGSPLSLSDAELTAIMAAAAALDPDQRVALLERVAAMCRDGGDVTAVVKAVLAGLQERGPTA